MTNTPQNPTDADMLKALTAAIQDCDSVVIEKLNALFAMDTQKFSGDVARALIARAEAEPVTITVSTNMAQEIASWAEDGLQWVMPGTAFHGDLQRLLADIRAIVGGEA